MSPHDVLMSQLIAMKKQFEQYVDEFKPEDGEACLFGLTEVIKLANEFPERSN